MSHPAEKLQAGVFAALRADAGVKAVLGDPARIYDRVPPSHTFPYATIGEDQVIDDGNTCDDAWECFVTIHVWSRDVGKGEAKRAGGAVIAALLAGITVTGFIVIEATLRDARYFRDADGQTEHGVIVVRYLIDPA